MKDKKHSISFFAAHVTSIVSITLVLLIVGVIALVGIAASNAGRHVREQVELNLMLQDSTTNEQAQQLATALAKEPFAAGTRMLSREQVLEELKAELGDVSEDPEDVLGFNPMSPEVVVVLKPEYASQDSVAAVCARLQKRACVESVGQPDVEAVRSMDENIGKLSLVLGIIALALIAVSFVLINNTVHLSIYARRFTIHTMKLVGATDGFIRRPFVLNSLLSGVIAAAVAVAVLWPAYELVAGDMGAGGFVGRGEVALVMVGLFVFGALISGVSALFATNRFLNMDYDDMFRI